MIVSGMTLVRVLLSMLGCSLFFCMIGLAAAQVGSQPIAAYVWQTDRPWWICTQTSVQVKPIWTSITTHMPIPAGSTLKAQSASDTITILMLTPKHEKITVKGSWRCPSGPQDESLESKIIEVAMSMVNRFPEDYPQAITNRDLVLLIDGVVPLSGDFVDLSGLHLSDTLVGRHIVLESLNHDNSKSNRLQATTNLQLNNSGRLGFECGAHACSGIYKLSLLNGEGDDVQNAEDNAWLLVVRPSDLPNKLAEFRRAKEVISAVSQPADQTTKAMLRGYLASMAGDKRNGIQRRRR